MKEYCITMYSHSSYSDAWEMFCGQIEKYFPKKIKRYAFVDNGEGLPENWKVIKYDESLPYNKRVAFCLERIEQEYLIFHHEDMPLYDEPNLDFLDEKVSLMQEDGINYIKLIRGGNLNMPEIKYSKDLYKLPKNGDCYFSVQPSICKTSSLKQLYKRCNVEKIHEFEPKACLESISLNHKNLYYYGGEKKRGNYHWDSKVYPYVSTAIVRGKWNYIEYGSELAALHDEYKIDKNIRGEFTW